jgi:acyl dehydratase
MALSDEKNEASRPVTKELGVPGIYAEDLQVGNEFDLRSHCVTEDEIIDFASKWDPQVFHVDPRKAKDCYFGGVIASGVHTLAVLQRLAVYSQYSEWHMIAGKALSNLELRRPVRPGDVLTGRLTIDRIEYDDRGRATVHIRGQLHNQHDELVMQVDLEALMKTRAEENHAVENIDEAAATTVRTLDRAYGSRPTGSARGTSIRSVSGATRAFTDRENANPC